MPTNTLRLRIPIRTRVGVVLAVCERLFPVLNENHNALLTARASVDDCWKWVEGHTISARQIYNHLEELSVFETSAVREEEINAICAVELTVQYTSWHAFRLELKGVPPQTRPVPNDMADITEDVVEQIIGFAAKADERALGWAKTLAETHCSSLPADELGPPVSRHTFGP